VNNIVLKSIFFSRKNFLKLIPLYLHSTVRTFTDVSLVQSTNFTQASLSDGKEKFAAS